MKKLLNIFANTNIYLGIILLIIPVAFLLFSGINNNNYQSISATQDHTEILSEEVIDPSYKSPITASINIKEQIVVPAGEAVTYGNKIVIPSAGINALIYECTTSVCGLNKGAWRLPDFGTPISKDSPIVLAAHRWGPDNLPTSGKIKNLFYNLDKVYEGDTINLIWDNQQYTYQITFKEENTHITRNEDLILVTCKYYNSDIRIIVYAKRVNI